MGAGELKSLPNIGAVAAKKLCEAGIDTPEKLRDIGAEDAFLRLRAFDQDVCINLLYGLEGAVQGIRWHDLDAERKAELLEFFRSLQIKYLT